MPAPALGTTSLRKPAFLLSKVVYPVALLASLSLWFLAMPASLWLDETLANWQVSDGFRNILERSQQASSSIGYLFILWFAKSTLGSREIVLRTSSVLAMLGAAYFLFLIARELFGRDAAYLSCILFCLQPSVIFASTEVLPYAFAMLAANSSIFVFILWMKRRQMRQAILLGAASAAILYFSLHYLFGAILPALGIYYVVARRRAMKADARQLAAIFTTFALLAVPILLRAIGAFHGLDLYHTEKLPVLREFPALWSALKMVAPIPLLIGFAATALIAFLVRKVKLLGRNSASALLLCILLTVVPAAILLALRATALSHLVLTRDYLLVAAPGAALTGGWLTSRIESRVMKQIFCVGLVIFTLFQYHRSKLARHHELTFQPDMPVKMRDGVLLRADICRPNDDGKYPVLLTRTPYDKNTALGFCRKAVLRGYVVVVEDVRGRFASDGDWYPFKYESQDGYDTVEWAASLPYSNGKVGMFGGSYVGATQLLAAIAKPPHLAGICPIYTASNYQDGWSYQGGAFQQWFNETWAMQLSETTISHDPEPGSDAGRWAPLLRQPYPLLGSRAEVLPPYLVDWLAHPNYDDYWKQWSIEDHYAQIDVPVFGVGAWYDIFLGGTLRNYVHLKNEGGTDAARRGQRLMIYVVGHAGSSWDNTRSGAVDFGNKLPINLSEETLRWYDSLLKGIRNGVEHEKPVKIFVMGTDDWREEEDWPLARAKVTRYFLHSTMPANGLEGAGTLSTAAPDQEKPEQFVYDPNDPVPTIGGPLCCKALPTGIGPEDQRPAEARSDVLVFSSPPFRQKTEVTGPISLDLYASSSALDTDFTGKVVDVWPSGFAQNLTEGILRLRYRNSREKPELGNPGDIYHLSLDLGATSNVFLPGHKLRLEVSSSNFPRFDRNLNNGEDRADATRMVKATNIIFHDKSHPSALILSIVP